MKVLLSTSLHAALLVGAVEAHRKKGPNSEERHAAWIEHAKRQNNLAAYPSGPGYDVPTLADITMLTESATATEPTVALPTPAVPGQTPFPGAPILPQVNLIKSEWPADVGVPPTDSTQVQEWLKEIEGKDIPNWGPTTGDCSDAAAKAEAGADKRCWWTCGGCTRPADITECKNKYDWGLTFDDGPAPYTPKLLTYLDSQNLKATFFLVGTSVFYRPEMVQAEIMSGHEISVHTWSHTALTTLTTAQIVAELGWTREIIKRVTGLTPLTMRPPYGDIDDRVRAISLAMGMVPVMWSMLPDPDGRKFDSNDWKVHSGNITSTDAKIQLDAILDQAGTLDHGIIVLEHDLYEEAVNLAIGYTIPQNRARNPPFNMKPVGVCQNQPLSNSYLETNKNSTNPAASNASLAAGIIGATGTGTGTAGAGQATKTPGAASHVAGAGGIVAIVGAIFGAFMTL